MRIGGICVGVRVQRVIFVHLDTLHRLAMSCKESSLLIGDIRSPAASFVCWVSYLMP
jgi:hypothetical protein